MSIYTGFSRTDIYFRTNKFQASEVKGKEEIWKSEEGFKMKFVYSGDDKLECIIMF